MNIHKNQTGSAMLVALIITAVVAVATAGALKLISNRKALSTRANDSDRAFYLAEAAVARGIAVLRDQVEAGNIDWRNNPSDPESFPGKTSVLVGEQESEIGTYELVPVVGANPPANPGDPEEPPFLFRGIGEYNGEERMVQVTVDLTFDTRRLGAAIISDSPTLGKAGAGKGKTQGQMGDVVFTKENGPNNLSVIGGILANGEVYMYDHGNQIVVDESNINDTVNTGTNPSADPANPVIVMKNRWGTENEVPDYTEPGADDQLFKFDEFISAADDGAGIHYDSLDSFMAALRSGVTMEGIIVVDVDPAQYVKVKKGKASITSPKLYEDAGTDADGKFYNIPGIDVIGTLLFNIAPNFEVDGVVYDTPPLYKVFLETPINVNPAPPAEVAAYLAGNPFTLEDNPGVGPSGYPPTYTTDVLMPWEANPYFSEGDDFPALMYNTGILDIHRDANISGVLYTPSFVEIEQKRAGRTQYFSGTIIAGGGVYLEDGSNAGPLCVTYNEDTVDMLATSGAKGRTPSRVAWEELPVADEAF